MEGDDGNYSCVVTVTSTQQEHTRTAYLQFACKPILVHMIHVVIGFTIEIIYHLA